MNRLGLLFVALLCGGLMGSCFAQCRGPQSCVGEGDLCFASSACSTTGKFCDKVCQPGLSCLPRYPDGLPRCTMKTLGGVCSSSTDCGGPQDFLRQTCSLATYRCIALQGSLIPGDFCTSSDQCADVGAFSGFCNVTTGRCQGIPVGVTQQCSGSTTACNPDAFCRNWGSGNTTCQLSSTSCASGSSFECLDKSTLCVGTSCTVINTADFGQNCAPSKSPVDSYSTIEASVCVAGQICVNGQCNDARGAQSVIGLNCTADSSVCTQGLSCICNQQLGYSTCAYMNYNNCPTQRTAYYKCLNDNGCHRSSDPTRSSSCANLRCYGAALDLANCANNGYYAAPSNLPATLGAGCGLRLAANSAAALSSFVPF